MVVSGPAGSGKTTLCSRLLGEGWPVRRVLTSTTRPPRPGEHDGVDYHFLDKDEFERRVRDGQFFEYAKVHNHLYGIQRADVLPDMDSGEDLLLNLDVQGAATVRRLAATDAALRGRVVTVFVTPLDMEELRRRLDGRGSDPADTARRLLTASDEMGQWREYDYFIESRSREEDYAALLAIYRAEKLRVRL